MKKNNEKPNEKNCNKSEFCTKKHFKALELGLHTCEWWWYSLIHIHVTLRIRHIWIRFFVMSYRSVYKPSFLFRFLFLHKQNDKVFPCFFGGFIWKHQNGKGFRKPLFVYLFQTRKTNVVPIFVFKLKIGKKLKGNKFIIDSVCDGTICFRNKKYLTK